MNSDNITLPSTAKAAVLLDGGEIEMILIELKKSATVESSQNPTKAKHIKIIIDKLSASKQKFHEEWARVLSARFKNKEKELI